MDKREEHGDDASSAQDGQSTAGDSAQPDVAPDTSQPAQSQVRPLEFMTESYDPTKDTRKGERLTQNTQKGK